MKVELSQRQQQGGVGLFFILTAVSLLLKSIMLYGFIFDPTHTLFHWLTAYRAVKPQLPIYTSFVLFLLSFAFLCKRTLRFWYLIGVNALVTLFFLIDLWYVRAFQTLPSFHQLSQLGNLSNLWGSVLLLVRWIDVLFVVDLAVFGLLAWGLWRAYRTTPVRWRLFCFIAVPTLLVLLYVPIGYKLLGKKDEKALFQLYDPLITCYNLSPIGYHVLDSWLFLKEGRPLKLTQQRRQEIREWYGRKHEPLPDTPYKAAARNQNLIVIQVESLENFVLKRTIAGQEITPTLNRLIANGLYFPNLYEQVNQGATSDAEFMTNTSVYPLRKGSTFFRFPGNFYKSLPYLLRQHGYTSLALHGDKGSYWNWAQALKAIGFDRTIDSSMLKIEESIGMGLSDASFFRQAAHILSGTRPPFYAFLVTMSSHSPYDLPSKYRGLRLDKALDRTTLGGYLQSIHYADEQIGQFLDRLKRDGTLANSMVAIYGDHEGVHKYVNEQTRDYPEFANGKRVPLIINGSGVKPATIATIGGQVDILPSLAYLLGIDEEAYRDSAMGRNLLKTKRSYAFLADGTYIGEDLEREKRMLGTTTLRIADEIIKGDYFRGDQERTWEKKNVRTK
ncbi:UNVERIFIED_CONTAM: lipoteichoic acid synthase [Brevibacillus sp. OAP136]